MTLFGSLRGLARSRVVRGVGLALAALVLAALVLATLVRLDARHRFTAAREAIAAEAGPVDPAAWAPAPVPAGENVFTPLFAGAAQVPLDGGEGGVGGWPGRRAAFETLLYAPPEAWKDRERLARVIAAHRAGVDRMLEATGRERSNLGIDYGAGLMAEIPDFIELLRGIKAMAADGRWELVYGDPGRAAAAAETLAAAARGLYREPMLLARLIAVAVEGHLHRLAATAVETGAGPEVLARFAAALDGIAGELAGRRPFREAMAFEAVMILDALEDPAAALAPSTDASWLTRRYDAWSAELIAAGTAEEYRELLGRADRPYAELAGLYAAATTSDPGATGRGGGIEWNPRRWYRSRWQVLIPNQLHLTLRLDAVAAARALARAALELRLAALASGRYPQALPGDPGPDPLAGGPAVYRRLADGGAALAYPAAAEVWQRDGTGLPERARPLLAWELPPPPAASGQRAAGSG